MKKIRVISAVFVFFLLIAGCGEKRISELPYYNSPDFTPLWMNGDKADRIHKIAPFSLTDQDGKEFTNNQLEGRIHVANFFFTTCPGICPAMTKNLLKVQNEFQSEGDIKLISYSVMPWSDSVSNLKNYEKAFNIKNGMWYLLRGGTAETYELARRSYFAEENAGYNSDSTEFLHTEHVLLVDKKGHIRGIYNGTLALDAERLIDDIKILMKES